MGSACTKGRDAESEPLNPTKQPKTRSADSSASGTVRGGDGSGSRSAGGTMKRNMYLEERARQLKEETERPLVESVMEKWSKEVHELPVASDLPRLAAKIALLDAHSRAITLVAPPHATTLGLPPILQPGSLRRYEPGGEENEDDHDELSSVALLHALLHTLTVRLGDSSHLDALHAALLQHTHMPHSTPSSTALSSSSATPITDPSPQSSSSHREYLDVAGILRDGVAADSALAGVLRAINQAVVAPAVLRLKHACNEHEVPFRDVRGTWRVLVTIDNDEAPGSVRVAHRKCEQSSDDRTGRHFTFEWCLEMRFDTTVTNMRAATLSVVNVSWDDAPPKQMKRRLSKALSSWSATGPGSAPKELSSMA